MIAGIEVNLSLILNIIRTIIDLLLVWYILYLGISMFKQNMRTMQLFKGVLIILLIKLVTSVLGLSTMSYLVDTVLTWGIIAVIVIFQPEIRSLLEKMGQTKRDYHMERLSNDQKEHLLDEIVDSVTKLSETQTGALITFERGQSLIDYINTGTKINADIKSELFNTIFWEGTPLHDGAVIIKDDRVVCAAAFFPPTQKDLSPIYGARHRAAIGISEITDSLTVVVSEETGTISFAIKGELIKIPRKELRASLVNELGWFKMKKVMKMSKNNQEHRDSTTDFFLNFISKEKEKPKTEEKHITSQSINDEIDSRGRAFVNGAIKVMNFINSTLDRMLQSGLSLKILSFILATILLFTVNGGNFENVFSTPNSGDYIQQVPVKIENLQDDFVVAGMPETVSVGLVGPSIDIYNAKLMKNYEIYADFSGIGEGEQTVELKSRNFSNDLEVLIVPQTVTVTVSQKVTKTFSLGYRFKNEDSLKDKHSVSVDSIEHSEVEVRGSQDNIDNVYSVEAVIDLKGVTDSFTQECKVKAFDRSGKALNVSVIPSTVKVDCSLSNYSKTVPLVPEYTGNVANGYAIDQMTFSKDKVKIYGDESKLKDINNIKVKVDVSDLEEGRTFKDLKLLSVSGVNKMSFTKVDGTITLVPSEQRQFTDMPIQIKNGKENNVSMSSDTCNLTVIGTSDRINALTNDDIKVYVDVVGLKKGRHNVKLEVELSDETLTYRLDSDEQIRVNIKK